MLKFHTESKSKFYRNNYFNKVKYSFCAQAGFLYTDYVYTDASKILKAVFT